MRYVDLNAEPRVPGRKSAVHKTRNAGQIPAVVYGLKQPTTHCALERKVFSTLLRNHSGTQVLINLSIGGQPPELALVREVQTHPVSGRLLHADFLRVAADHVLHTTVPIHLTGHAAGVGLGGILETLCREIAVECLPTDIPEFVEVDVSALNIGDSLHISDLTPPERVKFLTEGERPIVTVLAPRLESAAVATTDASKEDESAGEETGKEAKGKKSE